ncbi:MAG: GNAT family N-acetyltransferase [Anaerolineae bacterium]|nr:GNAT family N-acetyltransferase [Anaerolineae bacterium]
MFTDSTSTNLYRRDLGNNLVLKSVATPDDVQRVGAFNIYIHGQGLDTMTSHLINHHPHTHPDDWLFIEDTTTGEVVSALCLIPWTLNYAGVALKAGEVGIVGTRENYRRRGLIRALFARHHELLKAGEFHLSQIQGIPYYYRQFGYEYAMPLEGGMHLQLHQIPDDQAPSAQPYTFRLAELIDIPTLMRLYDATMHDLDICAPRDEAIWHYLLRWSPETETAAQYWLVLDAAKQPVGYVAIQKYGFTNGLNISEDSRLSHGAAMAMLHQLKALAIERGKPFIRFHSHPNSALLKTAQAWGGREEGRYAWQIHLPDVGRLLRQIAPVLERRVADSPLAGFTETVCLNLFREAYDLRFAAGNLVAVEGPKVVDGSSFQLPPLLFAPLVLGYRSLDELHNAYPDVGVWGQSKFIADILFPKMDSYIYTMY